MKNTSKLTAVLLCLILCMIGVFAFSACSPEQVDFSLGFEAEGEKYATITTSGTEAITMPEDPSKEGYTFDGWFWDKDTWAKPFTANSLLDAPLSSDMMVYAKFTPVNYTITYHVDAGTHENTAAYTVEDAVALLDATKEGYTFLGWYSDDEFTVKVTEIPEGTTGDMSLYAKFEVTAYAIAYENTKGAENSNPATYTIESETIILAALSKPGYTFEGWFIGDDEVTEIAAGSTGNITLTAKWTLNGYPITYHNMTGATNTNPDAYDVEDQPLTIMDASKTGYRFLGWFTANEGGEPVTAIAVGTTGEVNLYARWELITYTATFKADGQTVQEVPFTVETVGITAPGVPGKTGYSGVWENYTLIADNITVNAVYMPIPYTVTYTNTKDAPNGNPAEYNIESATITLAPIEKAGYVFDGWHHNGTKVTEIAAGSHGNITLEARWSLISYNITYMFEDSIGKYPGTERNPATYTVEDNITFISLVNHATGYTFDGWYTAKNVGEGEKVTGITAGTTDPITVYAHWTLDTYTVTYHNTKGATNTNATTFNVETATFEIVNLALTGYTFDGWYTNEGLTVAANTTVEKGTTESLHFYAKWTPIAYSIDYVLYNGTYTGEGNPDSYTIENGFTFVEPTLEGYVFGGWYTAAEGGTKVTGIVEGTTGNKTYYARWIHISTITFYTNGGSAVTSMTHPAGTVITAPVAPAKDYYTFAGWYTNAALTDAFTFTVMPEENITLYAKWTPTPYTITYVLNGGENHAENVTTYTVEDSVVIGDAFKVGYRFVGWFTDAEFTSAVVTEIAAGNHGPITLYANYAINQYTVSFESNGGTTISDITQNYATEVTAPAAPAKNGYRFVGWYSDSTLKNAYTFTTMPAEDITLYAKWELATYNITYHLNGGTNAAANKDTYTITSTPVALANPSKAGYTFGGWYSNSNYSTPVTEIAAGSYGDVEVFAKWDVITYTVTYHAPNGTIHTNIATYTVETATHTLTDASLKGHTFGGWYTSDGYTTAVTTIAGGKLDNIDLYAKFTANTYNVWMDGNEAASVTVSFDLNGAEGSVTPQTVTENTTLTYPIVPTRAGFVFGGWYESATCSGTPFDFSAQLYHDVTLYAKWVALENVTAITVGSTASVTLNGSAELKYMFIPLVSGNVTITTTGSYDTYGALYSANGTLLRRDDDTGSGDNFQIVYNVTAGEAYYIGVRGYSSSVTGTVTLSVNGSTTVAAGGFVRSANRVEVTFGKGFTLTVPAARDGYKFLGWMDADGVLYTDASGASVKNWDKDAHTTLVSKWERTVYTITFYDADGTTKLFSAEYAFGERIDMAGHTPTKAGKSFLGWKLSASDSTYYNATTMPDENVELYAHWTNFGLGTVKYDTDKTAISVSDVISPALFGVICLDTDGNLATVELDGAVEGSFTAGGTITVYFKITGGNATPKSLVIENVKVYGAPTLTVNNQSNYANIPSGLTAAHFGASGKDSFGNPATIVVRIEGEYKAGDTVTVIIESVDPAGNVTAATVENVKLYGAPIISYNEEKTAISTADTLSAALFGATATDSFGEPLTVTASRYSGTIAAGNSVVIRLTATDSKGNTTTVDVTCKVYGAPTIGNATTTDFKVSDAITPEAMGMTAQDTYGEALPITLTVKEGTQTAGATVVFTATVTDAAGNTATREVTVKIYGAPTITYDREAIKAGEDATADASVLNAVAKDSFGKSLTVTVTLKSGDPNAKCTYVVYTLTATDHLGNTASIDTAALGVYDANDITLNVSATATDKIKLTSKGEEFEPTSRDSFGNPCILRIQAAEGFTLAGGNTVSLYVVATDPAGNEKYSPLIAEIKVYATPTVTLSQDYVEESTTIRRIFTVTDSFGETLYHSITVEGEQVNGEFITVTVTATDAAGNTVTVTYRFLVGHHPHTEGTEWIVDVAPTCTAEGLHHTICVVCGWVMPAKSIPPIAHNYESGCCTECGDKYIAYTREDNYIYFGEYPQTLKKSDVSITSITDNRGYYLGSDGCYYAKVVADPYGSYCKFSNGSTVIDGAVYYFKGEAIRWRILDEGNGTALILCDSIIANHRYGDSSCNYANSEIRDWLNNQFYETAFTELLQKIILTTTVDNSEASTGYVPNPYACTDTEDKVFLLSYKEAIDSDYGFLSSDSTDTVRRMRTSDYSRATGAYMYPNADYYGNGIWWLRSLDYSGSGRARHVSYDGDVDDGYSYGVSSHFYVGKIYYGIVPALQIQLIHG